VYRSRWLSWALTSIPSFLHLFAALAEKERSLISTRTRQALAAAKARGVILGSPELSKARESAVASIKAGADQTPVPFRDKSIAPEQIETLVIDLSGRLRLLDSDIEAEEERTRCKDGRDAGYSILARTFIARRDNLSATITARQERLATLKAPEWNYS
jgi:hypothetical protein